MLKLLNLINTKSKNCNIKDCKIKKQSQENSILEYVKKNLIKAQDEFGRRILSGEIKFD